MNLIGEVDFGDTMEIVCRKIIPESRKFYIVSITIIGQEKNQGPC